MDTRYWGPSGWELLHLIAFKSTNPKKFLLNIGNILPCKFCRLSTKKFIRNTPMTDPGEWLYKIHNQVNNKLREQCAHDKKVVNPGENPSFEQVKQKYAHKTLDGIHGKEFLMSISVNYKNTPARTHIQKVFLKQLAEVYPEFSEYYNANPPDFKNYPKWMANFTKGSIEETQKYISKCRVTTCRKKHGGGRRLTKRA